MAVTVSQYATVTDMQTFGLTSATMATVDTVTQETHLSAASDLADSYLGSRFDLPLLSWGPALTQKVCELAAEAILTIRGYDPEDPGDMSIMLRGKNAREWFESVKEGDTTPNVQDSHGSDDTQFGGPNTLSSYTQPNSQAQIPGTETREGGNPSIVIARPKARGWR